MAWSKSLLALAIATTANFVIAAETLVTVHKVDANGVGAESGTVRIEETSRGLVFHPELSGLEPGLHGFHVHEKPSCAAGEKDGKPAAAIAAGDNLDPAHSGKHGAPWGKHHLGDLPALYADADGKAAHPVLAPRLRMKDVRGRTLMIHAGGDNYSDDPKPLGGGGARVMCGVIDR